MMYERVVGKYLRLGLRLGKLIDGFVDCWYGDPALYHEVDAERPVAPDDLARSAALLRSQLADSSLTMPRQRYLSAQLKALECTAIRLSGTTVPFLAEVRACFDVEIELGDVSRYAQVHDAIAELLPGAQSLRSKVEAFYERNRIPPGKLLEVVRAVSAELRSRARPLFGIPPEECAEYEVVRDRPWNAFNRYLGGYRSSITINAEAGRAIAALPLIATHEAYPGHHTEHCRKEAELVNRQGHGEHVISLVSTPQCLVSEGIAELAVAAALGPGWGPWTAEILADHNVTIDGAQVEAMLNLVRQLLPARQDAAIMLHDRGADPDAVTRYIQEWLLLTQRPAQQMVRFLTDPLWRAYSVTYVEGSRLVEGWLGGRPEGMRITERYQQLLDNPVLPSDLRDGAAPSLPSLDSFIKI